MRTTVRAVTRACRAAIKEGDFAKASSSAREAVLISKLIAAMASGKLAGEAPSAETASATLASAKVVSALNTTPDVSPPDAPPPDALLTSVEIWVASAVATASTLAGVAVSAACTLLAPSDDNPGIVSLGTGLTGTAPGVKDAACPLIAAMSAATVFAFELIPADVDVVASTDRAGEKLMPIAPEPVVVTPAGSMPAFAC